jgi:hypothetical protein
MRARSAVRRTAAAGAIPDVRSLHIRARCGLSVYRFFLHLGSGPDSTNNILALAFAVLIVFLVIAGSVWIIANLNSNIMPMSMQ